MVIERWGEMGRTALPSQITSSHWLSLLTGLAEKIKEINKPETARRIQSCDMLRRILTHQLPFKFDSMGLGNWGGPVAICGQQRGRSAPVPALRSAWWYLVMIKHKAVSRKNFQRKHETEAVARKSPREKQQYLDAAKLRENDAEDLPWGREGRHVPIADGRYLEIPMAKLVQFCFRLIWAQEMFTVKMYLLRKKGNCMY